MVRGWKFILLATLNTTIFVPTNHMYFCILDYSIYVRLPCVPDKKAVYLREHCYPVGYVCSNARAWRYTQNLLPAREILATGGCICIPYSWFFSQMTRQLGKIYIKLSCFYISIVGWSRSPASNITSIYVPVIGVHMYIVQCKILYTN